MEAQYNGCHYKARRVFLGEEFQVRLFDLDAVGIAIVIFQAAGGGGGGSDGSSNGVPNNTPLKYTRVFSQSELRHAGILRTLEGYVALVDSLELVEDAYFTGADAAQAGLSELSAYQLSSSLPGVKYPEPIVSLQAATAYLTRAPVGLTTWNASRTPVDEQLLLDLVAKGLTELCREKPAGLDAVKWLGHWMLRNNPTQPAVVHVD